MKFVSLFFAKLFGHSAPDMVGLADEARTKALDILDQHGLRAHYYMPAIDMQDQELANACRRLASAGYIITSIDGTITGKVAAARPTKDEQVADRRASIKIIVSN